jgi:DNA-binding response OmpR family regulator
MLVDARVLSPGERKALVERSRGYRRLLMLGVELSAERAALLTLGCAEAVPASVELDELAARAGLLEAMTDMLPRRRTVGPLTLDFVHRDARRGDRWLTLHPREFEVLWRLADTPGRRVTRGQLLREVWRLNHEPETNSVAVHVSRLRKKMADLGCEGLVATDPGGGYRLVDERMLVADGAGGMQEPRRCEDRAGVCRHHG